MKIIKTLPEETIPARDVEIIIHTVSIDIDSKNISVTATEDGMLRNYHTSFAAHWDMMPETEKKIISNFFKNAVKCCFNVTTKEIIN